MPYRSVKLSFDKGVAIIRLDREESLNALSSGMLEEILLVLADVAATNAKAILITGENRAFSAGGELSGDDLVEADAAHMLESAFHPVLRRLAELDIPVVSAINGPAAGAGMALALSADISVMARSAFLQASFVNLGLVPDCGLSWLLANTVGRTRALEIALLGERIDAERAHALGLVTRLAEDDACFEAAFALARRLAEGPSIAVGLIRKQIAAALDLRYEQVLSLEQANQGMAARTADFREGVAAFRGRRAPSFKGR